MISYYSVWEMFWIMGVCRTSYSGVTGNPGDRLGQFDISSLWTSICLFANQEVWSLLSSGFLKTKMGFRWEFIQWTLEGSDWLISRATKANVDRDRNRLFSFFLLPSSFPSPLVYTKLIKLIKRKAGLLKILLFIYFPT